MLSVFFRGGRGAERTAPWCARDQPGRKRIVVLLEESGAARWHTWCGEGAGERKGNGEVDGVWR